MSSAYKVDVVFNGGGGNDVFKSGPGNDTFTDTGAGTAVYSETLATSNFSFSAGHWTVTTTTEGTDTLSGVAKIDDGSSGHHFLLVGGGSQYATIQQAVDAAQSGDTILVAAGTYAEQVVVDPTQGQGADGISIVGIGSPIVGAPASLVSTGTSPSSGRDIDGIFTVSHASNVTIEGISVNGLQEGGAVTGANDPTLVGIAYLDASGTVDHVDVTGIRESAAGFGDQRGIAIYDSNTAPSSGPPTESFTLTNSTIEDWQKGAVVASNANVDIEGNTITGAGATDLIAQNGIELVGDTGTASNNIINAIGYTPATVTDTGILFWDSNNLTLNDNTFNGAMFNGNVVGQTGIYGLNSADITIYGNAISNVLEGIGAFEDGSGNFAGTFAPAWNISLNTVTNATQFGLDFEATDTSTGVEAAGNFTVTGTAGNDFFIGGSGNDNFTGGGGFDTAGYIENLQSSNFAYSGGHWTVTTATEGTDTLTGFSVVQDGLPSGHHQFLLVGGGSQYTTIQQAVDAAHAGDTILISAGTYTEQVVIDPTHGHGANGISIVGIGSVTVDAPPSLVSTGTSPSSGRDIDGIFTVSNASNVSIEGVTVNGLQEGTPVTGANNPTLVGIAYLNASGTVDHVDVTGIRESEAGFGIQRGIGIYDSNAAPGNSITITNSTVEDFQKGGIVVNNAIVEINHDTVTGHGATSTTAQNGIQVSNATGDVSNNTISGIGYIPAGTTSTGILFWDSTNLTIDNNLITGPLNAGVPVDETGIYGLNSSNIAIHGNTIDSVIEGIVALEDGGFQLRHLRADLGHRSHQHHHQLHPAGARLRDRPRQHPQLQRDWHRRQRSVRRRRRHRQLCRR